MSAPVHPAFKISDEMLIEAVTKHDDLDDCLKSVMDKVGITDGGVAGIVFSGEYENDWPTADRHYRLIMMRAWNDSERVNAGD